MAREKIHARWPLLTILSIIALFLAACGSDNTTTTLSVTPTAVPVNGFGTAANHVHSLLAFPKHVLLLATHYGLFRSEDDGASWTEVAAGPHQLMEGLMTYSLVSSPINPQRLYVLTQPVASSSPGTMGLYTSSDQGRTWKLSIAAASITTGTIFTAAAGNDTPDEVYVYLPDLGALGLKVSMDDGQHFSATGTLPFGRITGLLAIPGVTGQLLAYSSDGMARSTDGGIHWEVIKGITGGIFGLATSGPHSPIYASGDAGVYVSRDGGKTFTLVNNQAAYGSLSVSPAQTQVLYGRTGTAVYRSTDSGHTWSPLPHIAGNLGNLAVDPTNAAILYLSLSYPTEVYRFSQTSAIWSSLTPKA
jgi:photosystem II stability/assembly factor-like uncharacterized protein